MNYILKQETKTSVLALLFICIGNTISFAQTTCLKPFPQIARFPQYGNSGETRCVGDQLTLSPIASNTTNNPNFNPPIRVKWYKSGVPYNENIDPLRNEIKFESLKATDAGNYTIRTFYVSDDIDSTTCFAEKSYNVRVSMIPELHLDKREICLDDLVENGVRFSITGDSPSFDLVATVYEPRSSDGFPFLEPVYDPNSERTGVLKIPPGVIEAGIKVGERYDITNLSGANCHTDYSSIVDSILVDVSTEVELITNASCDLQTEIATVSSILPNTGNYEIVSQIPATGSIVNNVYTNSFLASGVVNYEYIIGNSLGCGSSSQTISNTIDCSCDVTGVLSLAVGSNDTISSGETTVLEVTPNGSFDGASSVYTVIITDGTTDYTVTNIAGGVHQFEVSSQGTYSIKSISDGNCERTGAGSVIIIEEETLAFTQNLSGDSLKICAGELINLQVVATGSNLTYQWKRNWVDIPGETSPSFTSPITASGHYLVVVNGDNGIIESESVYISFYEEVDVTTSTLCASEPTLGGITLSENEFQIVVAVNQGDKTTLDITETSTAGVVFTETSAGSGIWYSDAIEVSNFVDLRVTDFNHCNNGVFITGINKTCECQFSGVFSFLNSKNTLCPGIGDGVVLQVEPSGSINATATYDVVLTDGVNDFVPFNHLGFNSPTLGSI